MQIEHPEVNNDERESIMFPHPNLAESVITCHGLTTDFLAYGTDVSVNLTTDYFKRRRVYLNMNSTKHSILLCHDIILLLARAHYLFLHRRMGDRF